MSNQRKNPIRGNFNGEYLGKIENSVSMVFSKRIRIKAYSKTIKKMEHYTNVSWFVSFYTKKKKGRRRKTQTLPVRHVFNHKSTLSDDDIMEFYNLKREGISFTVNNLNIAC